MKTHSHEFNLKTTTMSKTFNSTIKLLMCVCAIAMTSVSGAQRPNNYTEMEVGKGLTYFLGNTTGASNDWMEEDAVSCYTPVNAGGNRWFRMYWAGCDSYPITLSTDNAGTNFDTKIHVYYEVTGTGALVCVAGDDDSGTGFTSTVTFTATVLKVYWIRVGGYGAASGDYKLSVDTGFGGCMDANACNYLALADWDNCYCMYPAYNGECNVALEIESGDTYWG